MQVYKIKADIKDERGFGDRPLPYYGIYIFLERGEKLELFDYKKFGLKLTEIGFITYKLQGHENMEELEAEFYAALLTQELTVFDIGAAELLD